jgi:hypothetical protein
MPGFFWGEAVHTAVYLLNRSPTAALDCLTPFDAWYGKKPPVHFLRVFGCVAYIKHLRPHPSKLEDPGRKVVFIGYEEGAKAYRFYDPAIERVRVARASCSTRTRAGTWGAPRRAIAWFCSPSRRSTSCVVRLRHLAPRRMTRVRHHLCWARRRALGARRHQLLEQARPFLARRRGRSPHLLVLRLTSTRHRRWSSRRH